MCDLGGSSGLGAIDKAAHCKTLNSRLLSIEKDISTPLTNRPRCHDMARPALTTTRLDYCQAVLAEWSAYIDSNPIPEGYMAGGLYNVDGGGANYLCLHEHPQWGYHKVGSQMYGGLIFGTESKNLDHADYINPFSTINSGGRSIYNNPVPCAACFVPHRSTWMMIPARRECPEGWTLEYRGYVHSQASGVVYQKTSYECIDEAPEVAVGATAQNQALIYAVQVKCGTLPCSVFMDGRELTCVVCTR